MRVLITAVLATILVGPVLAAGAEPEVGARVWAKCSACHSADPAVKSMLGPNLFGLMGRKVGSLDGYNYSPAMKSAGFVWTPEMLQRFLTAPQAAIPGTRMAFSGLKDPADRAAIASFLSSRH